MSVLGTHTKLPPQPGYVYRRNPFATRKKNRGRWTAVL